MIDPEWFVETLIGEDVRLFTGVPDSLMEPFCSYLAATLPHDQHVLASNEGAAVAIAMGHYLSSARPAVVYLQNAGFGNAVNPLASLADPEVYGIPMVLVVGWRGQPGSSDEPQHLKQGKIMPGLLEAMGLPWTTLTKDQAIAQHAVKEAVETSIARSTPYVIMIEKGTFAPFSRDLRSDDRFAGRPSREEALIALLQAVGDEGVTVATTGMLGRELYEHRQHAGQAGDRDLLTIGGMGHCCSVALGVALSNPTREVWCLDGDGSILMHLGSLAVIADHGPDNFFHVVFNNGVHDSVGAQPTSIGVVDLPAAAHALGYQYADTLRDGEALDHLVAEMRAHRRPSLLEIPVKPGNRSGIGRPERGPQQAKHDFMASLSQT